MLLHGMAAAHTLAAALCPTHAPAPHRNPDLFCAGSNASALNIVMTELAPTLAL